MNTQLECRPPTMTQVSSISSDLVTAYWLCKRKAFSFLRGDVGNPHEYGRIIEARAAKTLDAYLRSLEADGLRVYQGQDQTMAVGANVLVNVTLKSGRLEAKADALVCVSSGQLKKWPRYEAHLVLGTNAITKEHKLRLAFVGYVLSKAYHHQPATGTIVNAAGKTHRIQLPPLMTGLVPILDALKSWITALPTNPPPIYLNNHCALCPFQTLCFTMAEREDNLSLLDHMTPKLMQKYNKKGVFTITQLSYLFKPRRQRRKHQREASKLNVELQALALRTGKIYVQQVPSIPEHTTELFLDIEGVPDHGTHYLVDLGLVSVNEGARKYCPITSRCPGSPPSTLAQDSLARGDWLRCLFVLAETGCPDTNAKSNSR